MRIQGLHFLTLFLPFLCLVWQQLGVDVRYNTTLGNDNVTKKFVQLFVIPDGKLQVPRHDTLLLIIASCVASQFKDLGSEIFENSGEVDWRTSTNTLSVVTAFEKTVDTADRELETSFGRARLAL